MTPLRNLLLYRLAITNTCGFSLLAWAWSKGYVAPVFATDTTMLSYVIAGLFTVGLASTFIRAKKVSDEINARKSGAFRGIAITYMRRKAAKMDIKNTHIGDIANWLVELGLLGTVIGFYIAMGGKFTGDEAMITEGIRVAIGTTIIGGFASLWTQTNRLMLETATASYLEDIR